ncbi:MAG: acyl-CoA thioesterase [Bacteroidetes bacterium]|nr:acyl-CoA thioesterase [Bacteroidota bacterium]
MSDSKILESSVLIRFPDCDPFNHLNNARYLDYFINAREDHLWEHYKFNVYHYAKEHGKSWVVGANQIVYLKPAMLMETVVIQSTIIALREKDIVVEMMMWNKDKTQLKAVLWSTFVHFNLQAQKSEMHSKELMEYFKQFENPLPQAVSFEQRVADIKSTKTGI